MIEQGLEGRSAGIVLSFGVAPSAGPGVQTSRSFNELVLPLVADTFGETIPRPFWGGSGSTGLVELNVYPLVGVGAPPLPEGYEPLC